jgi:predicted NBD/HSP70 family sugar kinase
MMKTIGDQQLVKRINRSVLLRTLRAQPGLSRARLAAESGLTKSTVSALVRELLDDGWLGEAGTSVADGLGRPSTPLHINVGVHGLVGVEMAVEAVRVVGVSLLGEVLHSVQEPLQSTDPKRLCAQAAMLVEQTCRVLARRGLRCAGIGAGLPGAVDDETGLVHFAPNLGWRRVQALPLLRQALAARDVPNVPVHLQNEADVAALGEYEFGGSGEGDHTAGDGPLIFVTCDVGVGAGIVLNDRLFTGAQGMAGEIGHTVLQVDGPPCSCGRNGCAEVFIGARALRKPGGAGAAGHYLGVLLQNLWTTFNPRTIVVGGKSCVDSPQLVEQAIAAVQAYADRAGMPPPLIRPACMGLLAPSVGAAALVLHRHLRPMHAPAGGAAMPVRETVSLP